MLTDLLQAFRGRPKRTSRAATRCTPTRSSASPSTPSTSSTPSGRSTPSSWPSPSSPR